MFGEFLLGLVISGYQLVAPAITPRVEQPFTKGESKMWIAILIDESCNDGVTVWGPFDSKAAAEKWVEQYGSNWFTIKQMDSP